MAIVIKNVPEDKWRIFKSEAARHGEKHSEFFSTLIDEHMQNEAKAKDTWDFILNGKPSISQKEAAVMRNASRALRRSFKMGA